MEATGRPVEVVALVLSWYATDARDLPWRRPDATPWGVMVSEFMLQQTPVARVLAPWREWLDRWPTPDDLASAPASAAVAAWGRLGYPRRAQRLHAAAVAICVQYAGQVPTDHAALLALPGVGEYTASAIASFAHRQRHVVLDTNVRRVLARVASGVERPADHLTRAERDLARAWLPDDPEVAATWAAASMELGARICTARSPDCGACPIADRCAWFAAGRPPLDGPPRRRQAWDGTDRQCRGRLLGLVRDAELLDVEAALRHWPDREQAERCLASLLDDRLLTRTGDNLTL
ncbi:MAG TPA: A/G-specific adenine glycosylase [Propionibacteriaceae bacterium]|nr:A/G-specific adenine glycosylase [Propionibacteriaceae bacterium]